MSKQLHVSQDFNSSLYIIMTESCIVHVFIESLRHVSFSSAVLYSLNELKVLYFAREDLCLWDSHCGWIW